MLDPFGLFRLPLLMIRFALRYVALKWIVASWGGVIAAILLYEFAR